MKQYPYEITYKLAHAPNRRNVVVVHASHMAEAKRLHQASMPKSTIVYARPLPSNR